MMIYRRHLLPIGFLSLLTMLISLVPIYPNDLWWHMRVGETIVHTGAIPLHNRFSFLSQEVDFVYPGWLGQVLLYLSYSIAGPVSLTVIRNALLALAYAIALFVGARRSGNWFIAALLTLVGGLSAFFYWHVRPQIYVYPLFVILLAVLLRYTDGHVHSRWLFLIPLLTILWSNIHGSFLMVPLLIGVVAIGSVLQAARMQDQALWYRSGMVVGIILVAAAGTLINPWGLGMYRLARAQLVDAPSLLYGPEWHPSTLASNPLLFFTIIITLLTFSLSPRKPTMIELWTYVALVWQAWSGNRYIIWYGLALPMLVAPSAASAWRPRQGASGEIKWLNVALALLLICLPLGMQPGAPLRRFLPESYRAQVAAEYSSQLLARNTPLGAVAYLQQHPLPSDARLFNETADGSYLIWAWREGKVFVDTRIVAHPLDVWQDYYQIISGCGYNRLLDHYRITHILLNQPKQPGLAEALPLDPGWRELWHNSVYALYARSTQPAIEPPCRSADLATAPLP